MKSYHRAMHTTYLCLSAVLFKCAASLLGRAAHHKGKLKRDPGFFYPDDPVDIYEIEPPVFYKTIIKSPNIWVDAHPDDYWEK